MNKVFILEPKAGLCNQLYCICTGVILGLIYKRNIYFQNFHMDYKNENNILHFHEVIDLSQVKHFLKTIQPSIQIVDSINNTSEIVYLDVDNVHNENDIYKILSLEKNRNIPLLHIYNPISTFIPDKFQAIYHKIKLLIKFNKKYLTIANYVKDKLQLTNYTCMHIRMEDDAIDFMMECSKINQYNKIINVHRSLYLKELNLLQKKKINKIYICTSLGILENKNNNFYKNIKQKYNLIDKQDVIKEIQEKFLGNTKDQREIFGIIDFIIATDSIYFVGCDWSSFSIFIKNHHDASKKNSQLLGIWNNCKKIDNSV